MIVLVFVFKMYAVVAVFRVGGCDCVGIVFKMDAVVAVFRFGGCEFPPHIYFKIFLAAEQAVTIHYVSGKKMLEPASEVT